MQTETAASPETTPPARQKIRLGDLLVQQKVISSADLDIALAAQKKSGRRLGRIIVESGLAGENDIAQALARQLTIPFVDLRKFSPDASILQLLPETQARRFRAMPLGRRDGEIFVGMADPTDLFAYDEVSPADPGRHPACRRCGRRPAGGDLLDAAGCVHDGCATGVPRPLPGRRPKRSIRHRLPRSRPVSPPRDWLLLYPEIHPWRPRKGRVGVVHPKRRKTRQNAVTCFPVSCGTIDAAGYGHTTSRTCRDQENDAAVT